MAKELREYQKKIIDIVINSNKNQIICLPTGAGKTLTAFSLANQLQDTVCMIVPRIELIKQSQEAAEEFGGTDIIWADKTSITGKHLIVASKDSLSIQIKKNPKLIETLSKSILIFDECHESIKQTYEIVKKIKPIRFLGLTATPERADGLSLLKGEDRKGEEKIHKYGCFDEVVQEESVATLMKKGFLSKLEYKVRLIKGITNVKAKIGDELSDEQMFEIYDKNDIWGDFVECYEEFALFRDKDGNVIDKRPTLGFANTIKMAEKIVNLFVEAGYDFRVIHGGMNVKERRTLTDGLASKKIDGLVNVDLLTYGFDCPPVSYAFCTRHIKSRPLWFQIVGRILRTCEGKDKAIFVDHGDCNSEFVTEDSSLQIMNPYVDWNSNGLTKDEKNRNRKKQKQIQEILDFLQDLNVHSATMVTVDSGSFLENLFNSLKLKCEDLKIIAEKFANLEKINAEKQAENENLKNSFENVSQKLGETEKICISYEEKNNEMKSQLEKFSELENVALKQSEENEKLKNSFKNISQKLKETEKICYFYSNKSKNLKEEITEKQLENENLKDSVENISQELRAKNALCDSYKQKINELESILENYKKSENKKENNSLFTEIEDSNLKISDLSGDLTHEFCRKNYAKIRGRAKWCLSNFDYNYKSISDADEKRSCEHNKAVELLLKNINKENFSVNLARFNQDMNWWSANFQEEFIA